MLIGAAGTAEETLEFKHALTAFRASGLFDSRHDSIDGDDGIQSSAAVLRGRRNHGGNRHQHRAPGPSRMGAKIRAEAMLESFDGRFYTGRVTACDDTQEIGRGTVSRAVVRMGKFLERMKGRK